MLDDDLILGLESFHPVEFLEDVFLGPNLLGGCLVRLLVGPIPVRDGRTEQIALEELREDRGAVAVVVLRNLRADHEDGRVRGIGVEDEVTVDKGVVQTPRRSVGEGILRPDRVDVFERGRVVDADGLVVDSPDVGDGKLDYLDEFRPFGPEPCPANPVVERPPSSGLLSSKQRVHAYC